MSEQMKPSGIDYLLNIPADWDAKRFKYCAQILNGREYADIEVEDGGYPVIGSGGEFARASKYCFDGESVLLGRKGTINKPLYIKDKFWCVDTMFYTQARDHYHVKFLYYCALCFRFDYYVTSTALPSMTQKDLGNEVIAVPSYREQQTIAQFLDEQCNKIDGIISDLETQIDTLQRYKKSLILETVTKGLNKKAPMKPSGIDWIGDIPKHWGAKRLKYLLEQSDENIKVGPFGSALSGGDIVNEGKWVYNQRVVLDNNFEENDVCITDEKFQEMRSFIVHAGDLLITTRGTIGKVAIVPENPAEGILHPCIIKFRVNRELLIPELVKLIFNDSDIVKDQFIVMSNATTIEVIYSYSLKDIVLPVIPMSEQIEIYKFLSEKCSTIDAILQDKQAQLETIRQHKKSLIYEYVTGKKRVKEKNNGN